MNFATRNTQKAYPIYIDMRLTRSTNTILLLYNFSMAHSKEPIRQAVNAFEQAVEEPRKEITAQVAKGLARDFAQMMYGGKEAFKTDEEIEKMERDERMMKDDAYRRKLKELGVLKGETTNVQELTITPEVRKDIEAVYKSYSGYERDLKDDASQLGVARQNQQEEDEKKKLQEEEEDKRRKQQEEDQMNQPVESTSKQQGQKQKRQSSQTRMMTTKRESRAGQGVGG